jgi:hypothetical protein
VRRNPTSYKCSCGARPRKAADKECCNRWRREVSDTGHGEFCECVRPNSKQQRRLSCRIHGRGIVKLRNPGSGVPGGVEAGNQQPRTLLQPVPPQLLPLHSMHAALQPVPPQLLPLHSMHAAPTAEQLATLYLTSGPWPLPTAPGAAAPVRRPNPCSGRSYVY